MNNPVLQQLNALRAEGKKALALLVDPDKVSGDDCIRLMELVTEGGADFVFVGGSLLADDRFREVVEQLKEASQLPVVIFPGSNMHIAPEADAILLLSLISGRNPELLIGQHVVAAPALKKSGLEILPTGYILVDGGKPTTVSYVSNTFPIPADKPSIAACTALAGEQLGLKLIFLDAGSGALNCVSPKMVAAVRETVDLPIVVGGGIDSVDKATAAFEAGADVVVVGNKVEEDESFLSELVTAL